MKKSSPIIIEQNNKKIEINNGLFINNQFVESQSGKQFPSINPANGQKICDVFEGDLADVNIAVQNANQAFKTWSNMSCIERSDKLYKIYEIIIKEADNLAFIEALDQGKPFSIAKKYDVAATAFTFKYFAGWADKFTSQMIPGQTNEISYTKYEPYGVTGGIIPWNYPLMFIAWKAAPSLAAGNVIIIKPSEKTPLSALYFAQLIQNILPPGVIQIINGYGPTAGQAIGMHMGIKKIAFTGSTPVGKLLLKMSAQSNLKKVGLELGGKSPNIIFNDADLKIAVPAAAIGVFANAGQVCCACSRIYVQEEIYDKFMEELQKYTKKLILDDQWKNHAFYLGPVVDKLQYDRVRSYIELGVQEGAKLIGEIPAQNPQGYYIKPVIFVDCNDQMKIVQDEIFGPVAVIMKFKTIQEAINRANDSNYGLGAAVYSKNIDTCLQVSNKLQAGTVWVNNLLLDIWSQQLPFGGYKESGQSREGAEHALKEWSQVKTVKIKINSKL